MDRRLFFKRFGLVTGVVSTLPIIANSKSTQGGSTCSLVNGLCSLDSKDAVLAQQQLNLTVDQAKVFLMLCGGVTSTYYRIPYDHSESRYLREEDIELRLEKGSFVEIRRSSDEELSMVIADVGNEVTLIGHVEVTRFAEKLDFGRRGDPTWYGIYDHFRLDELPNLFISADDMKRFGIDRRNQDVYANI